jgi:uncharacterized membrane protein
MELIRHRKHAINITENERILSILSGGVLTLAGLQRKSLGGTLLALAGADLLRRGITGHSYIFEWFGVRTAPLGQGAATTSVPYELGIRVDRSITINRPRAEVYGFWRDLTNLPRFMNHVKFVRLTGDKQSHWVVKGPTNRFVEWDAVIHNEIENELIAWRTLPGSEVDHAGSVRFQDAPGGRGTQIQVELQYNPPAGIVGAVLAKFWGEEPTQQITADLRSLKRILEAGEIPAAAGRPSGSFEK